MSIRESTVEKAVCQWAKENGVTTLKLGGHGARGKADRLFMRKGVVAFCELKRPGEKPSPLQERFLSERRMDGFHAAFYDNAPEAIKWLRTVFF